MCELAMKGAKALFQLLGEAAQEHGATAEQLAFTVRAAAGMLNGYATVVAPNYELPPLALLDLQRKAAAQLFRTTPENPS